ncbi:glycoside hydrolase family 19 protein [Bacterioplanoides sp.]|uniref:glycoside hydrolase family 19 protein n=1 Tax=Bacterioplanoides sp. TaxID=2066072 RepID=UPI003B006A99
MTIFIRNTLTASVLLATVSLYGCGSGSGSGSSPGNDPQSTPDTANSAQTAPEMAVTVQKNYQNPDGSFNQQKFQQAQQAYIANGSQYQATDTQVFNPTISYSQPGTFVRYSEQQADGRYLVGDFRNKWFADAGTTPQFFPGNSPWELTGIALQVTSDLSTPESLSAELAGQAVVLPWRSEAAYPGGYSVKLNDVCYRNKWWTQAMPSASSSVWEIQTDCPEPAAILAALNNNAGAGNSPDSDDSSADNSTDNTVDDSGSTDNNDQTGDSDQTDTIPPNNDGLAHPDIPVWDSAAIYVAGNYVRVANQYYQAQWWTQGDMPPASEPRIAWSTPWKWLGSQPELVITDHCQGNVGSCGVTDGSDSPDGTSSETDTGNTPVANNGDDQGATDQAGNHTDQNPTPEIPPVIPEDNSDSSDAVGDVVATPAPLELPESGYEFLRQISSQDWDWLFPLRSGKRVSPEPCSAGQFLDCGGGVRNDGSNDAFTLNAFVKAVLEYNHWAASNGYKQFLNEGTAKQQAEEFVAFWAKSSRETSGSWSSANEPWIVSQQIGQETLTVWKGGLYWVEEVGYSTDPLTGTSNAVNYVDAGSASYPPAPGRSYYGRGVIQLSWNYNYGAFSYWLYDNGLMKDVVVNRDELLKFPNLVASNGELSILSGIWFWMTPQGAKPSSHDVMFGNAFNISASTQDQGLPQSNQAGFVIPTAAGDTNDADVFAYRLGTVINIVNGGLECNKAAAWHGGPVQRVMYYDAYAAYFNQQYDLGITRMPQVRADSRERWTQSISDSSPAQLQSATCYNQRSYYGW